MQPSRPSWREDASEAGGGRVDQPLHLLQIVDGSLCPDNAEGVEDDRIGRPGDSVGLGDAGPEDDPGGPANRGILPAVQLIRGIGDDVGRHLPHLGDDRHRGEDGAADEAVRGDEQEKLSGPGAADRRRLALDVASLDRWRSLTERRPLIVELEGASRPEPQVEGTDLAGETDEQHGQNRDQHPEHDVGCRPPTGHIRRNVHGTLRVTLPRNPPAVALHAIAAAWLVAGLLPPSPGHAGISAATACTIFGTPAGDVIRGTPGDDVICALEGNDQVDAGRGNDVLDGGEGDDSLIGGEGADVVTFETASIGVTADLTAGSASGQGSDALVEIEGLTGSPHEDVLTGTVAADVLSGLGATDLLFGLEGADTLLGGDGEDYLSGSGGSVLDGGAGTNTCVAGRGTVATVSCVPPSPPDHNDAHGFLDVGKVETDLASDVPVWKVVTRSRWSVFRMWDRGFILIYLDTFGADPADYYALVRSTGKRLRGALYRNGHRLAPVGVWREGRRSVSVRIPLRNLFPVVARRFYRWRVLTLTDRCRRTCFDRVPADGGLVQPRP